MVFPGLELQVSVPKARGSGKNGVEVDIWDRGDVVDKTGAC